MIPNVARVVAAAMAGVLLGGGLVLWWSSDDEVALQPRPGSSHDAGTAKEPTESATDTARETPAAARPASSDLPAVAGEREDGALYSARLQAFAQAELERGWRELRQDDVPADVMERGLQDYEQQIMTRAHWFGRSEAERRNTDDKKAALFAGDDGVALLQAITGDEPEAKAFVASDRFAPLFVRRGGGSAVDGTTLANDTKVPDGAIVSFHAGVFAVRDLARGNNPYPVDLTVRGAGMDATLLVVDAQRPRGAMQRLAIEDCTVLVEDALTDVRTQPAVLALSGVRFVGFDCGAGSAVAFYLSSCAMSAMRCRFEGGYGRSPQSYSNLMQVRGARLARFEQCVFDRVDLDDADKPSVLFVDCEMTEMLGRQPSGPTFRSCRYTEIARERKWDGDYRRRDLNTLFPQWQQILQRR